MYPECIDSLIGEFKKLPGIGEKTAERMTLFLLRSGKLNALALADAVRMVAEKSRSCSICFNTSEDDPCPICRSPDRDRERILVVEGLGDLTALEDAGWRGLYHVLQGALDPIEGVLPEHLTLEALLNRANEGEAKEIIIATNPDFEGDRTALLLARKLEGTGIMITRIARGIATGSKIEYANQAMLSDALADRIAMKL